MPAIRPCPLGRPGSAACRAAPARPLKVHLGRARWLCPEASLLVLGSESDDGDSSDPLMCGL
jgi:hypothetical protein